MTTFELFKDLLIFCILSVPIGFVLAIFIKK